MEDHAAPAPEAPWTAAQVPKATTEAPALVAAEPVAEPAPISTSVSTHTPPPPGSITASVGLGEAPPSAPGMDAVVPPTVMNAGGADDSVPVYDGSVGAVEAMEVEEAVESGTEANEEEGGQEAVAASLGEAREGNVAGDADGAVVEEGKVEGQTNGVAGSVETGKETEEAGENDVAAKVERGDDMEEEHDEEQEEEQDKEIVNGGDEGVEPRETATAKTDADINDKEQERDGGDKETEHASAEKEKEKEGSDEEKGKDEEDEEEEEEEEEEDEAKEPEDLSGGRRRKSVQRLGDNFQTQDDKKKSLEVPKGKGTALCDIPNVADKLGRLTRNSPLVAQLHSLIYGGRGKKTELKAQLMQFSGIPDEDVKEKVASRLDGNKWPVPLVKETMDLLEVPRSASSFEGSSNPTRFMLTERLLGWLEDPKASGMVAPDPKKRKSVGKGKKTAAETPAKKKAKTVKTPSKAKATTPKSSDAKKTKSPATSKKSPAAKSPASSKKSPASSKKSPAAKTPAAKSPPAKSPAKAKANAKAKASAKPSPAKKATPAAKKKSPLVTKKKATPTKPKSPPPASASAKKKKASAAAVSPKKSASKPKAKPAKKKPLFSASASMLAKRKSGGGAGGGGGAKTAKSPAPKRATPSKATKKRKAEELEVEEEEPDKQEEGDGKEDDAKEEPPAGPTSEKLRAKVEELIAGSEDVSALTFKMMKSQLEEHFDVPLGDRKAELIDILSEAMP